MPSESLTLSPTTVGARRTPRALHLTLWVMQALLAALFLLVGWTHAAAPIEVAVMRAPWVASLPVPLVRFIGGVAAWSSPARSVSSCRRERGSCRGSLRSLRPGWPP
jgi:hypothetical protein